MEYNVLDYGAENDGRALASIGIQRAIDACAENGGGTVLVPAGIYRCGTLRLKSNVELRLQHGCVLKASENMDDYNALDEYEQNFSCAREEWVGKHLILCVEQHNVALTGDGVIDGSGDEFYAPPQEYDSFIWRDGLALSKDKDKLRPGQIVCFIECNNVKVRDVQLRNTTCWGILVHGCDFVQIRGVSVFNPPAYANTDGIDIDSCSHVVVSDCIIDTGDDAIAIRGAAQHLKNKDKACEFIAITNCILGSSSSVFRVGVGDGVIRHVCISDIVITRGGRGFNIISSYGNRHTPIVDVQVNSVSAHNVACPLNIEAANSASISGVVVSNFRSDATVGGRVVAEETTSLTDIRLQNIDITINTPDYSVPDSYLKLTEEEGILFCKNVDGLRLFDVKIKADEKSGKRYKKTVEVVDCKNVER